MDCINSFNKKLSVLASSRDIFFNKKLSVFAPLRDIFFNEKLSIFAPLRDIFFNKKLSILASFRDIFLSKKLSAFASHILIFPLLFIPFILHAQIGIGEWRDHFSYSHVLRLSETPNLIIAYTGEALFTYDKSEHSTTKYSKINGLSDFEISDAQYSAKNKLTVLAYADANIDLLYDNQDVYNISDIHRKIVLGSPQINRVLIKDDLAYLACNFGIVVLDLKNREIKNTYFVGYQGQHINIKNVFLSEDSIYALTDSVLKVAPLNYPFLEDFSVWKNKSLAFPYDKLNEICGIDSRLAFSVQRNDSNFIYLKTDNLWQEKYSSVEEIRQFYFYNNRFYIIHQQKLEITDINMNIKKTIDNYGFGNPNIRYSIQDGDNIYIADDFQGLVIKSNANFSSVYPNGPVYSDVYKLASLGDYLYVAGGAVNLFWANRYHKPEIYRFFDENWNSNVLWTDKGFDLLALAVDPYDSKRVYAGSWSNGVYEFYDNKLIQNYNQDNSPLENVEPFTKGYVRVGGLAFDDFHNLWVTNSGVSAPLKVLKPDGTWKSFNIGNRIDAVNYGEIVLDDYLQKWVVLPQSHGILVYNDNYTVDDESDDVYKQISPSDEEGNFITNGVNDIALDKDGVMWIASDKGVLTYYNPGGFRDNDNFYASQVRVFEEENDTVVQYLLETQNVTAVAVDGANRKWLGTESGGVFLVSADGQKTIVSFNTENSPLVSNHINDIVINDNSGEVFFATDKGLVSYRGSATTGSSEFHDVFAFPNPVKPSYSGDITITGLITDSEIRITDVAGNLVFNTKALGGQAIWNGKNGRGERVASGVYLVFAANSEGNKTYVTKILFIN